MYVPTAFYFLSSRGIIMTACFLRLGVIQTNGGWVYATVAVCGVRRISYAKIITDVRRRIKNLMIN